MFQGYFLLKKRKLSIFLQTHHVDSTLKGRGNGRFHVLSTWNSRGVFVGFRSCSIFVFNKKEPQSCQFASYQRKALFEFLTSQIFHFSELPFDVTNFPFFRVIMRQLCISLIHQPKALRYFENTLKPLTEMIFLS